MGAKPRKTRPRNPHPGLPPDSGLMLANQEYLDPFSLGSWTPPVDICQTENRVLIRIELPGVDPADVALSFQSGKLRIRGIKRDPAHPRKLLCYYCLERRYGTFDRQIEIKGVLNPGLSRAYFDKGLLTVEIPTLKDRRGAVVEIPISLK